MLLKTKRTKLVFLQCRVYSPRYSFYTAGKTKRTKAANFDENICKTLEKFKWVWNAIAFKDEMLSQEPHWSKYHKFL